MRSPRLLAGLMLLVPVIPRLCVAASPAPLFEINTTAQEAHPFLPWQRQAPVTQSGFGILVASNLVLTTESVVRNQRFIELRREHSDLRLAAMPLEADPEVNLALLRIVNPADAEAMEPLRMAERLPADGRFRILQLDDTRALQTGSGQLVRITVDQLPNSPFSALLLRILVDLDIHAAGAPVLTEDGAVAGIVMSYDNSSRTAMVLPYPILSRFLEDMADGEYAGFAYAGFMWQPLVDPAKRRYLGAEGETGGVQVLFSRPSPDGSESLQPMDVLLAMDGHAIDAMGYYRDPDFGRLLMPQLVKRRRPGDQIPVELLRDGRHTTLSLPLSRFEDASAYIPEAMTAGEQDYLVEGGLVLYEMTGRWLRAHGRNWTTRVDSRLAHLYFTRRLEPASPGNRVVLLSAVLPHDINIGYQHLRNEIVTAVNGSAIRNLDDLFDIVERDGHISRLRLLGLGIDIVLDADGIAEANRSLQTQYNIPVLRRRSQ